MCGRFRTGRKLAYRSNCLRNFTLMLPKPPPTGVVIGPFNATRVRSMDAVSSFGMYSLYFSYASAPAWMVSHSNLRPVASRMRTTAAVTSVPMPSPGIRVILWVMRIGLIESLNHRRIESLDRFQRGFRLRLCFLGLQQVFQFRHKFLHVFKVEIDRCKPNIRDFVVAAQAIHDELADFAGLALALRRLDHKTFGLIHDLLQIADRDRPLFACA